MKKSSHAEYHFQPSSNDFLSTNYLSVNFARLLRLVLFILRRKTNQWRTLLIYNGACYGVENLHPARERYLGRVGTSGCRKEKILSSKSFLPTL